MSHGIAVMSANLVLLLDGIVIARGKDIGSAVKGWAVVHSKSKALESLEGER
jgi:hypothetical protein